MNVGQFGSTAGGTISPITSQTEMTSMPEELTPFMPTKVDTDEGATHKLRRLGEQAQPALRHIKSCMLATSIIDKSPLSSELRGSACYRAPRYELFSITCACSDIPARRTYPTEQGRSHHLFEMSPPCFGQG